MTAQNASRLFPVGETVELHYKDKYTSVKILKVDGDDVTIEMPTGSVIKFKSIIEDGAMVPDEGFWMTPNPRPVGEPLRQSLRQRFNKFLDSITSKTEILDSQNLNQQVWTPWPPTNS